MDFVSHRQRTESKARQRNVVSTVWRMEQEGLPALAIASIEARMAILLSSGNPDQVSSFQHLTVDLIDPTRQLHILSGIAIPAFEVDDDDNIYRDVAIVDLGFALPDLQQAVAEVGLASFSNDDSSFVFAVDKASVDADGTTGAVKLSVNVAVSGDSSSLNRFGFQVVIVGGVHATGISGRVTWDRGVLDATNFTPAQIASLLVVNANTIRNLPPPNPGGFGSIQLTPIASTIPESLQTNGNQFWVPYSFDHLPLVTPMQVTVTLSSAFPANAGAGQVSGPLTITLLPSHLSEAGVDFLVAEGMQPR